MIDSEIEQTIQIKYKQLAPCLNETSLRLWAAVEAMSLGHGGVTSVARTTGLSRTTIHTGMSELKHSESEAIEIKRSGAVRR